LEQYDGTEAFIEVLNAHGVEKIFFNPGGEQGPLLATISKFRILGKKAPQLVLCLDESVALTAGHGHYVISGRPQVVLVHSELGTLQLGGALHNAEWGRVPVIVFAGAQAAGQRVDWMGEHFDQGRSVRNCVKWDHTIGPDENLSGMFCKKPSKSLFTEPCGPVYLAYPRDSITKKIDKISIPQAALVPAPVAGPVDAKTLNSVADTLIAAKNPLIVAGYTGRYPESVAKLVELAETLSAPVLTGPVYMNFPTNHPLCAGIDQILGSRKPNPYLPDADVILVLDYDVSYAAAPGMPSAKANIIQFDIDPLTSGRLLWGRGANTFIKADSRQLIPALTETVRRKMTPEKRAEFKSRFSKFENIHKKQHEDWHAMARSKAKQKADFP